MRCGGLQKFSLIDYPGKICAIIFTQGCNFRCPYCHNPELVDPGLYGEQTAIEDIFLFLSKRHGKLDGVVITGGEPTLQKDLAEVIIHIKRMGFLIKLDTNGSSPSVIEELVGKNLIDYIAMDVKAPLDRYHKVTLAPVDPATIKKSIDIIIRSGIDHEFRTTIVQSLISEADIPRIGAMVAGAQKMVLQKFIPSKTLDNNFATQTSYTDKKLEAFRGMLATYLRTVIVR
jgi:pyruvate formate lyase activating enzyme